MQKECTNCRVDPPAYVLAGRSGRVGMLLAEERECYVPELLSDPDYEASPDVYAAAEAHGRRLRRAERLVNEAGLLAEVLRAAMGDAGDARAMQVDAVMAVMAKKLCKARAELDRQDTSNLNLFLAYAALKTRLDAA